MTTNAIAPLYLSRLLLDPRSRQVWSELAQPYEMHRTLMHAFERYSLKEKENTREKFGVLFRTDVDVRTNRVVVYVQSKVEPDWSFLDRLPGYVLSGTDKPNPACKDVAGAYQQLQDGQVLSFRLRANPTKRIGSGLHARGDEPGKDTESNGVWKGKRVGLLREEDQIAWLIRKGHEREIGKHGGFEILMKDVAASSGEVLQVPLVNVRREGKQRGRKKENGRSHETTHLSVLFDGLLRITDANDFRETLARGIGSAKAYGFGLLSVSASGDV